MSYLVASLLALLVGPLSYHFANRAHWAMRLLDVVVVVAVGALVILHILPETVERGGVIVVLPLVVGLLGPTLIERLLEGAEQKAHAAVLAIVLLGLAVHALTDGLALQMPHSDDGLLHDSLPMAVVLHRIPVSLLLWWLLRPRFGVGIATLALLVEGGGTLLGYAWADWLFAHLETRWMAAVQALVAGSLLHVVVDRREPYGHVH